ncbi:MAG: formimidoylglutamase [Leeuwenhoekiella sp.]|nr:MAG: formimidoylglutamase [Leeuwenhoekiella sp.]
MKNYRPTTPDIWQGRKSESQLYLNEIVEVQHLKQIAKTEAKAVALLGYCCDEGVRRNLGRVGAKEAPDAIRNMLGGLANHWEQLGLVDFGNFSAEESLFEDVQEQTAAAVEQILKHGYFPVVLGGGHDLAYAHFKGIRNAFPHQKIGILNLDAHFDLRDGSEQGTSGTPFWQIAQEEQQAFNYCCLGIQKAANNNDLFKTAEALKVSYLLNTEFTIHNWSQIKSVLDDVLEASDSIYLSIDLDGFASTYAPGVSAPSPMGFQPDVALNVINYLVQSQKLVSVDLVELNPKYDLDHVTSRLASRLIYELADSLNALNN